MNRAGVPFLVSVMVSLFLIAACAQESQDGLSEAAHAEVREMIAWSEVRMANGLRESDAELSSKIEDDLRAHQYQIQNMLNDAHADRKQLNDESETLVFDRLTTQLDAQRDRLTEILDQYRLVMRTDLELMVARDEEIWAYLANSICPVDHWLTSQTYALLVMVNLLEGSQEFTTDDAWLFLEEGIASEGYNNSGQSLCSMDSEGQWALRLELQP